MQTARYDVVTIGGDIKTGRFGPDETVRTARKALENANIVLGDKEQVVIDNVAVTDLDAVTIEDGDVLYISVNAKGGTEPYLAV